MANLRTNNLCGEGGRNAYGESLYFNGDYNFLSLASGVVPSFGTGDFTVEFWINQGVNALDYTILISLLSSTPSDRFEVAIHSSTIHVYTDTGTWRDTGYAPTMGVYEHIAFQRDSSGNTLKMYANGEEKWSVSNTRDYDEAWSTKIGSYNDSSYGHFRGYISNLRICIGHTVYSSNYFTPPTSPLTVHYTADDDKTVLLCCQNSDDASQEATGRTITPYGSFGQDKRTGNLISNGLDWAGSASSFSTTMPDGWVAGNGATVQYESGGVGGGSEDRNLRLRNDGSNSYITQAIETVIGQRYFYNVHLEAQNSNLGLRISAGTSAGDNTNLSNQFNAPSDGNEERRTGFFTATATTTYFNLQIISGSADQDVYWDDVTVTPYNPIYPKVNPPYGVDAGNTFDGAISMNSSSWMYFPTGKTEERGRGRALIGGGSTPSVTTDINFLSIQSLGRSTSFGELSHGRYDLGACSSGTRAVFGGGRDPAGNEITDVIDFVTIATTANAIDFGNLTAERGGTQGSVSSSTRGIWAGGFEPSQVNKIEFVTIANTGNATDFGDLTSARSGCARAMSPTRGLFASGGNPSALDIIDYITIASTGNAQDFGDTNDTYANGGHGTSSNTRGIFAGLGPSLRRIDYVTIASTGDAKDFGDMRFEASQRTGTGNAVRGIFAGGYIAPTGRTTFIDQITIASTGNATAFGDLIQTANYAGSTSDSHGGLS